MKPIHTLSDDELAALAQRAQALESAPEHVIQRAIDLWKAPDPHPAAVARAIVNRIRAALTFDSWATPGLALGIRNVPSASAPRQLLFSADGRDLDLRITPAADRFKLSGQILGPDASGSVELVDVSAGNASPAAIATCTLDDIGEFHLPAIAPGRYTIVLYVAGTEIELPAFEVGERYR